MLAPVVLTLALAPLVAPARASVAAHEQAAPSAPPGEVAPPAAGPQDPAVVSSASPGWEWGVGLVGGRRSGWWSPNAEGGSAGLGFVLEGALLAHVGERFAFGAMLSGGAGLGGSALLGARFRLSRGLRLDLLADGGLTRQELGVADDYLAPTFGGRVGITWDRPEGGSYLTLGLAARHLVPDRTVPLVCGTGEVCGSAELGGGTLVGAFVTVGRAHPSGR
jgi:hypothetical protein